MLDDPDPEKVSSIGAAGSQTSRDRLAEDFPTRAETERYSANVELWAWVRLRSPSLELGNSGERVGEFAIVATKGGAPSKESTKMTTSQIINNVCAPTVRISFLRSYLLILQFGQVSFGKALMSIAA